LCAVLFDISSKVSPHQLINQAWADLMGVDSKDDFLENGSVLDVIPKIHHAGALDRCEKVLRGEAVGESQPLKLSRLM